MAADPKTLLAKLQQAVGADVNEGSAAQFLSGLSTEEYQYLIDMFEHQTIAGFTPETQSKLVLILKKLQQALAAVLS